MKNNFHIKNFEELATNPLREKALLIAEAGLNAIDIEKAVDSRIKVEGDILELHHPAYEKKGDYTSWLWGIKINLKEFKRIFIVGIGKGSALASAVLAQKLGDKLAKGIVIDVKEPEFKIENSRLRQDFGGQVKLKIYKGTHPLPSKQNIKATKEIITLAENLNEDDLLINFICGGGSALACASDKELKEAAVIFKELTSSGADIKEMNIVRKHISEFKGGGFAKIAYPARVVSLIVSDVIGNDMSTVASGPTVFDMTTKEEAENVLKKYGISLKKIDLLETPKDQKYFKKIKNILFVCNNDAVLAMEEKAKEMELSSRIFSLSYDGEAREALVKLVDEIWPGGVLLAAGETTVTLKGAKKNGKGSRNQEAALGLITNNQLLITNNIVALALASDGHDNNEAAGAIVDSETVEKAKKLKLEPEKFLENHDSFHFFEKTGDLIFAEQKSFNVADLMVIIKEK
ncbi:MAG: DUF4147 domain-containing protein [Candidatus Wolfebacteria bacterium]|nr:DUF4147 domain-containing protein [Candidatus Wolfebacteria bacterium]